MTKRQALCAKARFSQQLDEATKIVAETFGDRAIEAIRLGDAARAYTSARLAGRYAMMYEERIK